MSLLPELPVELWTLIVKHAITRPCDSNRFNPPTYDLDCVRGFASASATFREIVQSLSAEVIVVVWDGFLAVNSEIARRTRHLEITDHQDRGKGALTRYRPKPIAREDGFEDKISQFSQLTSLSLRPFLDPYSFLDRLQALPVSESLQSLDIIRDSFTLTTINGSRTVHFPNLIQLRLYDTNAGSQIHIPFVNEKFVTGVASFLSGSLKLKLLSFHAALDDVDLMTAMVAVHRNSIEHLQPSEGYERHIAECPLCTDRYDRERVASKENAATRILADKLPALEQVRWANLWLRKRKDEDGQRRTTIIRGEYGIMLLRDDGLEVD